MGLEIGFDVWKNENGKLVKYDLSKEEQNRTWVCGRTDVTYAWGYEHNVDATKDIYVEPVFNEEFDNYQLNVKDDNYKVILTYVEFDKFKEHIMQAVNEEFENMKKTKTDLSMKVGELKLKIKDYQELLLRSTTDFVFDKLQKKIDDTYSEINDIQQTILELENDDYDYNIAKSVQEMVEDIENYLKQGLVVSTYYSY